MVSTTYIRFVKKALAQLHGLHPRTDDILAPWNIRLGNRRSSSLLLAVRTEESNNHYARSEKCVTVLSLTLEMFTFFLDRGCLTILHSVSTTYNATMSMWFLLNFGGLRGGHYDC